MEGALLRTSLWVESEAAGSPRGPSLLSFYILDQLRSSTVNVGKFDI
jgi:hypothetical protein